MTETTLDQHMAVVGRVIAKFVSTGLMTHNIDSRGVERFLGTPEDKKVFEAVIVWMLDEGIIRAKNQTTTMDGTIYVVDDNSLFSKIGELLGSAAGSFAKSVGSG